MKSIIITGANGNLGTATVKKFLDEGYKVIAVDSADNNLGFARNNQQFELHSVNLADENAAADFVQQAISKHGTIAGALLLVGGFAMGGIDKTAGQDLKKMYTLNFETAYYTARPLFQHMLDNNYGRLVLVGARPALLAEAGKGMIAYALSKSLLFKLAEFMNAQAKGRNVVASVIVPSTIDTPQNRESMPDADPNNWVKAEQLAEIMEFICGNKGQPLRESVYKVYNNS
ncbi:MAG TPA: SDR family NAD(P)-dependent oxidoreductase [Chitinophagaceae bacterium]|nr:SDR family NAD(P)-dependent oxidoreductase [Chitinophagaceae bacterium]